MQVTNVRVSFLREKQPAQYEKAAPAVEFVAVLDAGEDHAAAARKLMIDATSVVYAGIGYDVPTKVATALASGVVPAEVAVEVETTETTVAASVAGEVGPLPSEKAKADVPADEKAASKKPRGRPKGSKNTRPKAGTAAAKKAAAAPATTAAEVPGDDDIPGDAPRVGPDDDPKDHGVEAEKKLESKDFTAKDLHTMIIDLINAKKLSVPSAKQLLAHFQVARAQDLTADQVVEGKAMVEKMVAAG